MSNLRKFTLAVIGGLLAAGIAFSLHRFERRSRETSARELAALRSRLETLATRVESDQRRRDQQSLAQSWRELNQRTTDVTPQTAEVERAHLAPEAEPKTPVSPESTVSPVEVIARLDSAYESERIDPVWSRPAVDSLRNHVTQVLPPHAAIRDSDCRGTLCRMRLSLPDHAAYIKFAEAAFHDPSHPLPENGASLYAVEETKANEIIVVAYTARAGANIPNYDSEAAGR
jgi:hypothetical protein